MGSSALPEKMATKDTNRFLSFQDKVFPGIGRAQISAQFPDRKKSVNLFNYSCSERQILSGCRPGGFSWDFFNNISGWKFGKLLPVCPFQFFCWCWRLQDDGKASPTGTGEEEQPGHPQSCLSASQNPTPEEEQSCCVGLGLLREKDNWDQMLGFDFGDDW